MPIVGTLRRRVIMCASAAGTVSSTTAYAPASSSARASAITRTAWRGVLPCTLWPPKALTDCGVSPTWPITGMPASTSLCTVLATRTPPSSFTEPQPVSCMMRVALRMASCQPVW